MILKPTQLLSLSHDPSGKFLTNFSVDWSQIGEQPILKMTYNLPYFISHFRYTCWVTILQNEEIEVHFENSIYKGRFQSMEVRSPDRDHMKFREAEISIALSEVSHV